VRVSFILNRRRVSTDCHPETLLIDVLRETFGQIGARPGCVQGECGFCSVLVDDSLALSCMLPMFRLRDRRVTTIDSFLKSSEYRDIELGFRRAGIEPCRFCVAGKVLTTYEVIRHPGRPDPDELDRAAAAVQCRCTSYSRYRLAIRYAAEFRRKRENVRRRS
jgi:carbon-monoxide dehydrogenase small subunit